MRRNRLALFVLALAICATNMLGCAEGGSPTGPGSSFVNPNPGDPIEVRSVTPATETTVTEGDTVTVSFRVYTIEGHGVAGALVFLRDDGQTSMWACGKAGRGFGSTDNVSVTGQFWVTGHEVTLLILSKDFKSQAEYEAAPTCVFRGAFVGQSNQVLFEQAHRKEEFARYRIG